jgi:hypothetical protein
VSRKSCARVCPGLARSILRRCQPRPRSSALGIFLLTLASLTSLEGDLGQQIQRTEREPGVRRQL